MDKVNYEYDVFLSWTGKDRILKDQIRTVLEEKNFKVYDSERDCAGRFRDDYARAIAVSKVFLPIITNNLLNDPNIGGDGTYSEVRNEFDLARDADARGILNIQLVCLTDRIGDWRNCKGAIDFYFSTLAAGSGFSRIDGTLVKQVTEENQEADENAPYVLQEKTLLEILHKVATLVRRRDSGSPVPTQYIHFNVEKESIYGCSNFAGRDSEIKEIASAFLKDKARAVVLRGIGGIGKSELAKKFANEYDGKAIAVAQFVYLPDSFEYSEDIDVQLYNLLNNIDYVPHVRAELRGQTARKDQLDIMLGAISKLPPYALLIIDNCNFHYTAVLTKLLQKTKCNYLLTSRTVINDEIPETIPGSDVKHNIIKAIDVDSLLKRDALDYFEKESGRQFSLDEFDRLYKVWGGNTIGLCITARQLRTNSHKSIDDIITEFSENRSEERVHITHNDTDKDGNVLDHLGALFNMNQLSEKCKDILRGMSLLDNGTLTMDEIRALYCLDNNNEINALTESGWLHSYDNNALVMHPVIAHLAVQKLNPNKEKDKNIIDYLLDKAKNARSLPVNEALHTENKLYYALLILARSEGRLYRPLWNCFVDINSCHASYKEVEEKKKHLLSFITDKEDLNVLSSYTDMVLVRQNPSAIEVLEKYLDKLSEGTDDYKWVSQMLSASTSRVIDIPVYKKRVGVILHKALEKAMEEENDAAVLNLSLYLCFVEGYDSYKKTLLPYIKAKKKQGKGRDVIFFEMLLSVFKFFPEDAFTSFQKFSEIYSACLRIVFGTESDSDKILLPKLAELYDHTLAFMLKHPILMLKYHNFGKDLENVESVQGSKMAQFLDPAIEFYNEWVNTDEINIRKLYEYIYKYYRYLAEEEVTLNDPREAANAVIFLMLQSLPAEKRESLLSYAKLPEHQPGERYTLNDLTSQEGYIMILCASSSNDKKQLIQVYQAHQEKLLILMDINGEDDYRVIDERMQIAAIAEEIGGPVYGRIALDEYKYVYDKLSHNNENSSTLLVAGRKLLTAPDGSIWKELVLKDSAEAERQLRELITKLLELNGDGVTGKAYIINHYLTQLNNLCKILKSKRANSNNAIYFNEGLSWAAKQLNLAISGVSRASSDDDISWIRSALVDFWNTTGICASIDARVAFNQKCIDMVAMLNIMVKRRSANKKAKSKARKTIKKRYAMIQAEYFHLLAFIKDKSEEKISLRARAVRIACRNGIFNSGFCRNIREIYLFVFLAEYHEKCQSDSKPCTIEWVELLTGKNNRYYKRIKELYNKIEILLSEQKKNSLKELKNLNITEFSQLFSLYSWCNRYLKKEKDRTEFAPSGINLKEYSKCKSVGKYVLLILEAVYKYIPKNGVQFKKVTIPSPTAIPSDKK